MLSRHSVIHALRASRSAAAPSATAAVRGFQMPASSSTQTSNAARIQRYLQVRSFMKSILRNYTPATPPPAAAAVSTLKQPGVKTETDEVPEPFFDGTEFETDAAIAEAEVKAKSTIQGLTKGTTEHVSALKYLSKIQMYQRKFVEARETILQALDSQQVVFRKNVNPQTFLSTIGLLSQLVTTIRMCGVDPNDLSPLDTVFGPIYEQTILPAFLAKDPAVHQKSLEHPAVYTFICYVVGCYIDGEAFTKAKQILARHLLADVETSKPSSIEGSYDLKDLRIASALNILAMALHSDHSACGGGDHSNHHHTHDHSAASASWRRALEFCEPFLKLLQAAKPVGQLDATDLLFLQAASVVLDNLSQVSLADGQLEQAAAYGKRDVSNLECAYAPGHPYLVGGQAQYLRTLLECQQMDEAELLCEHMLRTFPHPKPTEGLNDAIPQLPEEVTLDTSRTMEDLSQLMFQWSNLDYAEKFQQISLQILRARLVDMGGKPVSSHLKLAQAHNGLGLLQIQMQDYANAEKHLQKALQMKLDLFRASNPSFDADKSPAEHDESLAEFYHNLGLAQLGLKQSAAAEASLLEARKAYLVRFTDKSTGDVNKVNANYAGLLSQLAQLYKMRNEDRLALKAAKEALEIKSQLFVATSPQLLSDLYFCAAIHANQLKEYHEAIPLFKRVIAILERPQGKSPPTSRSLAAAWHCLAACYDKTTPRELAMAADAWRKSIVALEKSVEEPLTAVNTVKTQVHEIIPIQRELKRVLEEMKFDSEVKELEEKIQKNLAAVEAQKQKAVDAEKVKAAKTEKNQAAQPKHAEEGTHFTS